MTFWGFIKRSIKMNDLFYASEMLRYDKQLQYRTLTGGLISLGIIIAVIIGFASMIIDTLSLNTINFTQTVSKDTSRSYSQIKLNSGSNFMLAVELWEVNMTAPVQYFSVGMVLLNTSSGLSSYSYSLVHFEKCTRQHWSDFPQIAAQYDVLSMDNWLCPPRNTVIPLFGDYTSNVYQYVNISVNRCVSWFDPSRPCANSTQMSELFHSFNNAIRFKIYYTKPLINPGQKSYKSYYLQSENYIRFGPTIGGEAYLYASDYSVKTDNSIWPFPSISLDQGIMIEDKFIIHPFQTTLSTYAAFFIVKSPTAYTYQRSVQKISTVFSFIGGLVSAVSGALFILKMYNNFSYQVSMAVCIFKPEDENIDSSELQMNLFTFIKVKICNLLNAIGKPPDWPQTQFIIQCQEEITNQLDIKALVKRVIFMEYCMSSLFQDYQLEGLQIQKPKTPKEIRQIRQAYQFGDIFDSSEINSEEESNQKHSDCIISRKQTISMIKREDPSSPAPFNDKQFTQTQIKTKRNQIINLHTQIIKPQVKTIIMKEQHRQSRLSRSIRSLSSLKQDADEGNHLSKKIWNKLEANPIKLSRFKHRIGNII